MTQNTVKIHYLFPLLFILALTIVSATTVYGGETVIVELEKPFDYYSIVGNSTEVVLDITQDGNNVTIIPSKYSESDSYEVVFFDNEKETITIYRSSGGGGSSTRTKWKTEYVDRDVTEYVDKEVEVEVPGPEVEVEKIINKTHWVVWLLVILLAISLIVLMFYKKENTDERRYETNEQENSDSSNASI